MTNENSPLDGNSATEKPERAAASTGLINSTRALLALAYMAAGGCVITLLFCVSEAKDLFTYGGLIGVALMTAFGSAAAGGLLGFIFGVPFTKDSGTATVDQSDTSAAVVSALQYRPNTSLEQISDWLAKMFVGIGLVEIREIPAAFQSAAKFVAKGMGETVAAQAYAYAALVFFTVCGFLFGFLWARFNLRRLFSDADRDFAEKLSRFDIDGKAFALAQDRLAGHVGERSPSQEVLNRAVANASPNMRKLILSAAVEVGTESDRNQFEIKDGVVSVFRALVAADKKERYFQAVGELGVALGRVSPPEFEEGRVVLKKAIDIRDRLGRRGWRWYDFCRAYYGVMLKLPPGEILPDLSAAAKERDRFLGWLKSFPEARGWADANSPELLGETSK
jgi:hypothetical protein